MKYFMTNLHLFDPDFDDTEVIFIDSLIKGSKKRFPLFFLFFMKGG